MIKVINPPPPNLRLPFVSWQLAVDRWAGRAFVDLTQHCVVCVCAAAEFQQRKKEGTAEMELTIDDSTMVVNLQTVDAKGRMTMLPKTKNKTPGQTGTPKDNLLSGASGASASATYPRETLD